MYSLEVVFTHKAFDLETKELWNRLSSTHSDYIGTEIQATDTELSILYENYGDFLKENNFTSINADVAHGTIFYNSIFDLKFSRLDIKNLVSDEADAEAWLSSLLLDKRFIQGRIYDNKYDKWENMEDLLSFKAAGRSYEGLPLKTNGLPFPLEQQVVDISNNPGRWKLQTGYIESIGSIMWLGEEFWKNTVANKEKILACNWLELEQIGNVLKLKAQDEPFTLHEGQQAELQNQLRDLLYS